MLSIKKIITSMVIFSLIMPVFLVSSVWGSGGAVDDSAICNKGSTVLIGVLANDTGLIQIGPISSPKHGTAVIENGKIRYTPDPNWYGIDTFTYSASTATDTELFCPDTGHYYEYILGTLNWNDANAAASAKTFYGLKGYLVTITSEAENSCVASIMADQNVSSIRAWVGAADVTEEAKWVWATGPEAGTIFSIGAYPDVIEVGYSNWDAEEPNNFEDNEHYGQFIGNDLESSRNGKWNGCTLETPQGYIVEFGGMPNDVSTLPTATVTVIVLNNSTLSIHAELKASYNNRLKTVNSLQTQILNKLPADCKQSGVSSAGCSVPDNVKSMWNEAEQYIQNAKKTGNVIKAVNDLKKAKELLEQILGKI